MGRLPSTLSFSILNLIFITSVFCDTNRNCGFIEIVGDKQDTSNYANCTHATAVRIVNTTKLVNLDFLNNLQRIDFDFRDNTSAREGAAVIITNNINIRLDADETIPLFPNLTVITYKGPYKHHLGFIIMKNGNCVHADKAKRLTKIAGGVKYVYIIRCFCNYSELISRNINCEGVAGNIFINKTNSKNWHLLQALTSVKKIYGRIHINDTELENLDFFNNVNEINYKNNVFLLEIHNNRLLSRVNFESLPRNLSAHDGSCYKLIKTTNNPLLNRSDIYRKLEKALPKYCYDSSTRVIFFPNEKFVSIQDNVCVFDTMILGKTPNLQSGLLGTCSILRGREIIINQDFNLNRWGPALSRVTQIRACVIIENTTLENLNFFATLEEISYCEEEEFLRIRSNHHLKDLQLGIIFCPKQSDGFHPVLTITDNPLLCFKKVKLFEYQTKMTNNITYNIDIPKNAPECDDRLPKYKLKTYLYYIAVALAFFSMVAVSFYIQNFVIKKTLTLTDIKIHFSTSETTSIAM